MCLTVKMTKTDSETLGHPEEAEDENTDDDFQVENDSGSEFFLPHETSDEDDVEIFQSKNVLRYPNLCLAASRFGVSNCAAACIANATLIDLGNLTEPLRLDHNKIRRGRRTIEKKIDTILKQRLSGRHGKRLIVWHSFLMSLNNSY